MIRSCDHHLLGNKTKPKFLHPSQTKTTIFKTVLILKVHSCFVVISNRKVSAILITISRYVNDLKLWSPIVLYPKRIYRNLRHPSRLASDDNKILNGFDIENSLVLRCDIKMKSLRNTIGLRYRNLMDIFHYFLFNFWKIRNTLWERNKSIENQAIFLQFCHLGQMQLGFIQKYFIFLHKLVKLNFYLIAAPG